MDRLLYSQCYKMRLYGLSELFSYTVLWSSAFGMLLCVIVD